MVLLSTSSMPVSNNENVSLTSIASKGTHSNTHTRRQRYRFQNNNTSLGNSHRSSTREATRRMSHTAPVVASSRVVDLANMMEDIGLDDESPKRRVSTTAPISSLPRYLRRPAFRRISPSAIQTIEPDLVNVSIEFVQRKVRDMSDDLFFTIKNTETNCPKGRLPRELEAVINDVSGLSPTHIIATYSQPNALQKQRISIHPVHALVLATNCANLPPLPYSKPSTPKYPGGTVTLPVIPLAIQNPETFPILLEYLYTQRTDSLLRSLLPLSPHQSIPSPEELTNYLGSTCSSTTLRTHLRLVHGFWSNVAALGVFDEKLWRTMEAAWEVLHGALACP